MVDDIDYPIRINKYLAYKKISSRREADALIARKKVYINGALAILGTMVKKGDVVELKRGHNQEYVYLAYNKPRGIITHSPKEGEESIADVIGRSDVFPLSRLDKDSEGLIILTSDGRITKKLLSPETNIEKEYQVYVDKPLEKKVIAKLEAGVNIEGYVTKKCKAKILKPRVLSITITEGKKHQVRRMLASLGYTTMRLSRVRIATITLGGLKPNEYRELVQKEKEDFLSCLGM